MNIEAKNILSELRNNGVFIEANNGKLHIEAPKGSISKETVKNLQANKQAILDILTGKDKPECSEPSRFAANEVDMANGKPVYSADDEPFEKPASMELAATDLMILAFACNQCAKALNEMGQCPGRKAYEIQNNLNNALAIIEAPAKDHSANMPEVEKLKRERINLLFNSEGK